MEIWIASVAVATLLNATMSKTKKRPTVRLLSPINVRYISVKAF